MLEIIKPIGQYPTYVRASPNAAEAFRQFDKGLKKSESTGVFIPTLPFIDALAAVELITAEGMSITIRRGEKTARTHAEWFDRMLGYNIVVDTYGTSHIKRYRSALAFGRVVDGKWERSDTSFTHVCGRAISDIENCWHTSEQDAVYWLRDALYYMDYPDDVYPCSDIALDPSRMRQLKSRIED